MSDFAVLLLIVAFGLMMVVLLFHVIVAILFGIWGFLPILLPILIIGWIIAWYDDGPMPSDKDDG